MSSRHRMLAIDRVTALCAISALLVTEAAAFEPKFKPTIAISRLQGEIVIDGELGDSGWTDAARADGFAEVNPGDQVAPPVESEAFITYDDEHLYVALIAYDDPSTVRVSLRDRDQIFQDDYFGIMLDTYGDLTKGYELFVNPIGIQGDLRMQSDGNEDLAFDIVWYSEGKVTDTGYQVEIAVPFASLRFPDQVEQVWRVNFWRDHQRDLRRRYAWAAQNRDDPCFMCQWGKMTGIRSIRPGSNLDIIGTVVGAQAGTLADSDDPSAGFANDDPDADVSLTLKYGITSNSVAELTLNPDFSQVESDAGQIDVNTTFALFFPERRPFFQEGSDLYNTWISAIYTRSINDPSVAGKASGQYGRSSFVYTFARDRNSPLLVPFEQKTEDVNAGPSVSNIVRARHSLHQDSYIGALFTDRRLLEQQGSGTTVGADSRIRFLQNYQVETQLVASHTEEPDNLELSEDFNGEMHDDVITADFDGQRFWGHGVYASLERNGRVWSADFDYWLYSPRFRTDNGFTTRNDFRETSAWTGLFYRPNRRFLVNWEPSIGIGRIHNYRGVFADEWIRPNLYFRLPLQTDITFQYLISRERFDGVIFDGIRVTSINWFSRLSEFIDGGARVSFGQQIRRIFHDDEGNAPELGDQFSFSADLNLKPARRLRIETSYDYERMQRRETGEELFEGYILRARTNLNFTKQWFLRLIIQYDDFSQRVDVEPLLTYRVNPYTLFFVGATSRMHHFDSDDYDSLEESTWKLSEQQYFLKLQYLFQY